MANRNFWSKSALRIRITNRLETGVCISNAIHQLIGGWPPYIYDLWMGSKLASVYLWFINRLETALWIHMIFELVGNQPLYIYDLQIDWRPVSVCIWFINWLKTGFCTSMIYTSITGWPLCMHDLWSDWKPVSVPRWFMNCFFSWTVIHLYQKSLKRNHWIILSRLLCGKIVWTKCNSLHQWRKVVF